MSHAGRKPLSMGHLDQLNGSARAKDRLRVFLETLRGTLAIADACELLGLSESHFHQARHSWLQEALELLEPRRMGRPPKQEDATELRRQRDQLEAEVMNLRSELEGARVREEIARILTAGEPGKKTTERTMGAKPR